MEVENKSSAVRLKLSISTRDAYMIIQFVLK